MRPIPQASIDLVKVSEGCHLKAYRCPAGIWTIGYGTTGFQWIKAGATVTQEQADDLLEQDLLRSASSVERLTKVHLNDNQFAALIDFVYNLGGGCYQASTIRARLNRKEYKGAADYILKYVYGGGRILPGLVKRRRLEYNLFMS